MSDGPRLVVVSSLFPEPNETFVVRELAELRRRGFQLTIFSLRPRPAVVADVEARALLDLVNYPPSRVVEVLGRAVGTLLYAPVPALRAIGRGLGDVVRAAATPVLALKQLAILPLVLGYARRLPAPPFRLHAHFASMPTTAIRILAAFSGQTYGFTAHAWDIHVPENKRQLPVRIAGADLVVTCTAFNQGVLTGLARTAADGAKVMLSYHGLDLAGYVPGEAREPDLIVGGASLTEKKGLHHLIAACARLRERGVPFRCLLIGEGPDRPRLEAQLRATGLEDRIRLTGQLPHREVVGHLARAAVMAHPSVVDRKGSMDGIPNTILEAMAVGTPVIASALSGIPEVVVPERTGLLVEPGDEPALADALERLLCDGALRQRLGAAGRALVLERFDVERNVGRLATVLGGR